MVPPSSDVDVKKPGAFLKAPGKWLFILHPYGRSTIHRRSTRQTNAPARRHQAGRTASGNNTSQYSCPLPSLHSSPSLPDRASEFVVRILHLFTYYVNRLIENFFRQHPNPRPRGAALIFLFSPRPFPWAAPPGGGWPSRSADSPTYSCWKWRDPPSPAPPGSSCGPGTEA